MLRCKGLSYTTQPPRRIEIFKDIDFKIEKGENTVIYGDNGAGKSTLVKLLTGVISPTAGEVKTENSAVAVFEDVEEQILFSTVKEEMEVTGKFKLSPVLKMLQLDRLRDRSTLELSFTQKARLGFYTAWQTGKHFMLVDSPVNDEGLNRCISSIVRSSSRTVILFLPSLEKRQFTQNWKKMKIKNQRLSVEN